MNCLQAQELTAGAVDIPFVASNAQKQQNTELNAQYSGRHSEVSLSQRM